MPLPKRKKISNETIRAIYPILRSVAHRELTKAEGINEIDRQFQMNRNSARDFIDNFIKMLRGEKFQRLNTIFQTELYLQKIGEDFGQAELRNAISSLRLHLDYALKSLGDRQPGIRAVLAKYTDVGMNEASQTREGVARKAAKLSGTNEFDPGDEEDAREWVQTSIARRQGQPKFRDELLTAYEGKCAISGCKVSEVLEAAHIQRYLGLKTNHVTNGLLLRSDLHTLFDHRLISIDPNTMIVLVAPELKGTAYEKNFAGKPLRLPKKSADHPNTKALEKHLGESGLSATY